MTIDRPRLQRLATRRTAHTIPICRACGISASFVWDFHALIKTCRECGFVDGVEREAA